MIVMEVCNCRPLTLGEPDAAEASGLPFFVEKPRRRAMPFVLGVLWVADIGVRFPSWREGTPAFQEEVWLRVQGCPPKRRQTNFSFAPIIANLYNCHWPCSRLCRAQLAAKNTGIADHVQAPSSCCHRCAVNGRFHLCTNNPQFAVV